MQQNFYQTKTRIWDAINSQWLFGYESPNVGGFSIIGETLLFGEFQSEIAKFSIKDLNNLIQTHWSGLKDAEGREIYEGDIVQESYEDCNGDIDFDRHLVVFKNGCFQFAIQGDLDSLEIMCSMKEQEGKNLECKIIGNIFETPQLLEKL